MTSCSPSPRVWETKASDVTGGTMEARSASGSLRCTGPPGETRESLAGDPTGYPALMSEVR